MSSQLLFIQMPKAKPTRASKAKSASDDIVQEVLSKVMEHLSTVQQSPPAPVDTMSCDPRPMSPSAEETADVVINAIGPILTAGEPRRLPPSNHVPDPDPSLMGMSFSAPLGSHVPQQLREKIHAGVFVELSCLLPDYATDYDYDGEPRRLKQRSLPSLDFFDFTSAFIILTAIRCKRFPSEDMREHLETVRAMHKTWWQCLATI
jgi:hypothetical protein